MLLKCVNSEHLLLFLCMCIVRAFPFSSPQKRKEIVADKRRWKLSNNKKIIKEKCQVHLIWWSDQRRLNVFELKKNIWLGHFLLLQFEHANVQWIAIFTNEQQQQQNTEKKWKYVCHKELAINSKSGNFQVLCTWELRENLIIGHDDLTKNLFCWYSPHSSARSHCYKIWCIWVDFLWRYQYFVGDFLLCVYNVHVHRWKWHFHWMGRI